MNMPAEVLRLLQNEKFCFLGTSYRNQPHVSLMNFTYLPQEELIILSSREDTTKVKHLKNNSTVSLLLYNHGEKKEESLSCTISGEANILKTEEDNIFREKHYDKNRDMGSFIVGEDVVVITIKINHILLSDAYDSVREWSFSD